MEYPFPYPAVLLTIIFAAFATVVTIFAPECITAEECSTEGVQNEVVFWATDFFVGATAALFALHLNRTTLEGAITGVTFLMVALGYLLKGCIAIFFGNNGTNDGKGMMEYFILTVLEHVCWTCSVILFYHFFQKAWSLLEVDERLCRTWFTKIALLGVLLSTIAIVIGSMGLVFTSPDALVKGVVDAYEENQQDVSIWVDVVAVAQFGFSVAYGAFLIAGAVVFGGLTKKEDVVLWGLPTSIASRGIILCQMMTIATAIFYTLQYFDHQKWSFFEDNVITQVVLSYVMMITFFLLHNLIFALLPTKGFSKCDPDTDEEDASGSGDFRFEGNDEETAQRKIGDFAAGPNNVSLLISEEVHRVNTSDQSRAPSTFYRKPSYFDQSASFYSTSFETNTLGSRAVSGNFFSNLFRISTRETIPRKQYKNESQHQNRQVDTIYESKSFEQSQHAVDGNDEVDAHSTRSEQIGSTPDGMIVMLQAPQEKFSIGTSAVHNGEFTTATEKDSGEKDTSSSIQNHVEPEQQKPPISEVQQDINASTKESAAQFRRSATSSHPENSSGTFKKVPWFPRRKSVKFLPEELPEESTIGEVTKAEASIWNGCRQNVEYPLDSFRTEEQPEDEKDQEKIIKYTKSPGKRLSIPSFRWLSHSNVDDASQPANESIAALTTAPCEASIWNGRKEALEVSLGSDQDLASLPEQKKVSVARKLGNTNFSSSKKDASLPEQGKGVHITRELSNLTPSTGKKDAPLPEPVELPMTRKSSNLKSSSLKNDASLSEQGKEVTITGKMSNLAPSISKEDACLTEPAKVPIARKLSISTPSTGTKVASLPEQTEVSMSRESDNAPPFSPSPGKKEVSITRKVKSDNENEKSLGYEIVLEKFIAFDS